MCYQKSVTKLMSGVPVPEATTHVMSLLFSSSYEEVLEMLQMFNLHFTWHLHDFLSALDTMVSSHFQVRHWSDAVEKLL